ncbi:thiamine transporter 2 isoform X2 [Athalia rosae]|uniref:thiamine transporter 2 isoform X2 n=1 Tax=Athalia rosae TaxID=37344 RepID=UPI002033B058|nr:thiamine transporter 2 isoform X2 [Athalia rosae]
MDWTRISLLLCVFGFLKEFRPSEPFVTEYLTGPWKNFTEQQAYQEIYPVGTYSYLTTLVAVFLLTDFVRYKPVIILCGLAGSCTFIIMISAQTIWGMEIVQFFYGLFQATEVAYYTYIYAKVSKIHYQEVTSHVRMAILLGRFTASVASQLIVSFNMLDYGQLIYLTITGIVTATLWTCFLPSVAQSIYFHPPQDSLPSVSSTHRHRISASELELEDKQISNPHQVLENKNLKEVPYETLRAKFRNAYHLLWRHFLLAYSDFHVLKWSIWWAFATCGYVQVITYVQLLWQNSIVEGGALAAFGIGKLKLNWPMVGETILSFFALMQGSLLVIAAQTYSLWLSYIAYILFGVMYQGMITVASSEVAKKLSEDSYGLIFGLNTFLATLLQSALTFVVTGGQVLNLTIRLQYLVYGGYFLILGGAFMLMAIITIVENQRIGQRFQLWQVCEDIRRSS